MKTIPLVVLEDEDNVKLQCSAAGIPRPLVTWKRADGAPIVNGTWKSKALLAHTISRGKL